MKFVLFLFLFLYPSFNYGQPYSETINLWYNVLKSKANYIIEKSVLNTKCAKDLKDLIHDSFHRKVWAVQMLDSNIKLNPGLLAGNIYQFGNYDQCLAIHEEKAIGDFIKGQYCSVIVMLKGVNGSNPSGLKEMLEFVGLHKYTTHEIFKHLKAYFGVCLPHSCSIQNLQSIWDTLEMTLNLPVKAVFDRNMCSYAGKPATTFNIDVYIHLFFGTVLAIVVICTIYEFTLTEKEKENNLLVTCSLYYNSKKLLSTHCETENLKCLYGIKTISMMWVVLGHRFLANSVSPNFNSLVILKWKELVENSNVLASTLSVDTFFVTSGILLCYVYRAQSAKNRISLVPFYLHRFIRLFPALLATVLFYIGVLKHLSHGPFWHIVSGKTSLSCRYFWWSTIFFMTNHINGKYQCVEQTWYLAVDSQLYLLSPLILFNLTKYRKKVITGIIITGLLSIIYTAVITIVYNIPASPAELNVNYYTQVYAPTFVRMPSWLIGILFGNFIFEHKNNKIVIPKYLNIILWIVSLCTMLGLVVSHVSLTGNYGMVIATFFNAIARPLWAVTVGFVVFACSTDHGGFVNTFLSAPVFIVLGKLTYSMYLMHLAVLAVIAGRQRAAKYFGTLETYHEFFGDYIFSLGTALVWCLLFESPVMSAMNIYAKRIDKQKKNVKETATQVDTKYNTWIFRFSYKPPAKKID